MASEPVHYPWFKKEDTNAFFALFQNNIANFVIIAITMLGFGFPESIVFGQVIPGAAVAVLVGNLYYAWYAARVARQEGRTDVTALSYGISTPVMFVFLFGVLLPAKEFTGDPQMAWRIAVAACFLSGLVEVCVSVIGGWVQRNLPRAAMLGALAGVALTFIAGQMLFTTYEMPVVGLIVLGVIIVGIIGQVHMPFRIPASLFAIVLGTGLAYLLGQAEVSSITEGLEHFGFYPLVPTFDWLDGFVYLFGAMAGILTVVLPITIYNAIETMNDVEAMKAEGNRYAMDILVV
jgi:AGZA family xanthine/uracil permease-like MFS transporter